MNPRQSAIEIWTAGVDAVRAGDLIRRGVRLDADAVHIEDWSCPRSEIESILVVGAGKAGTQMAGGLVDAVDDQISVRGFVNVPAGTEIDLPGVTLHPARPAGVNEPTRAGVEGTRRIVDLLRSAPSNDLVVIVLSGGGSALLPMPIEGVSLADKLAVIRHLSGSGADIVELNTVRKHLSAVKGGGLIGHCRAKWAVTVILSDVIGDPLDMIASGPTVHDSTTPDDALQVLSRFDPDRKLPPTVYDVLHRPPSKPAPRDGHPVLILGSNGVAVDEAGVRAESLGFNHAMHAARPGEGTAEEVGRHLADMAIEMLSRASDSVGVNCLITGGEPTVRLCDPSDRGRGGRNQQLVLAAYQRLLEVGLSDEQWKKIAILSGGTDGEDGPTDAAGAFLDADVHAAAVKLRLNVADYLQRNDAYTFFDRCGGLLMTGPTGTNVCDIRVVVMA